MTSIAKHFLLPSILEVLIACDGAEMPSCDEHTPCVDPARPFCDVRGEWPASEGMAGTCIPSPFGVDAGNDAGGALDSGQASVKDAGVDAESVEPDAGPRIDAATVCAWAPLLPLLTVNSPVTDRTGSLGREGLTLYFARFGSETGPDGVYYAEREGVGQSFGLPTVVIQDSSGDPFFVRDVEISSSELEIFYVTPAFNDEIQTAIRSSSIDAFIPSASTRLHGQSMGLSGDGLALYYVDAGTVQRATRSEVGASWEDPVTVLPTGGFHGVDVSSDELRLLLTGGPELVPIAIAERESIEEPFGSPIPVSPDILPPDGVEYVKATWDGVETQMVVTVRVADRMDGDLYYSRCQ